MTNDLERVTKIADEFEATHPLPVGTTYNPHHDQYDTTDEYGELCNQLYTSKYRAWQEQSSLTCRLRKLDVCGYQPLTGAIGSEAAEQIEQLQAKLAMQADVITRLIECKYMSVEEYEATLDAIKSITSTQSDVDAWIAAHDKKLLDEAFGEPDWWLLLDNRANYYPLVSKDKPVIHSQSIAEVPLYRRKETK